MCLEAIENLKASFQLCLKQLQTTLQPSSMTIKKLHFKGCIDYFIECHKQLRSQKLWGQRDIYIKILLLGEIY